MKAESIRSLIFAAVTKFSDGFFLQTDLQNQGNQHFLSNFNFSWWNHVPEKLLVGGCLKKSQNMFLVQSGCREKNFCYLFQTKALKTEIFVEFLYWHPKLKVTSIWDRTWNDTPMYHVLVTGRKVFCWSFSRNILTSIHICYFLKAQIVKSVNFRGFIENDGTTSLFLSEAVAACLPLNLWCVCFFCFLIVTC